MYRPWAHKIWIPAPTGVRNQNDVPNMGALPIGLWDHRVMIVGGVPVVFGGMTAPATPNIQTYTLASGTPAPIRVGDLNLPHAAENNQQGMGYINQAGNLMAIGDPFSGVGRQADIYNAATKTWALGPLAGAAQGLSGVSMILAPGQANTGFACSGDNFSLGEYVIVRDDGTYNTTPFSGSPINYQRPFSKLGFLVGTDIWTVNGGENVGPAQNSLLRLDTTAGAGGFVGYTAGGGLFSVPWYANYAAGIRITKGIYAGHIFIAGGLTGAAPDIATQAWRLDVTNRNAPVTTAVTAMPNARATFTMHEMSNGLIACIGGLTAPGTPTAKVDLYYPDTDQWFPGPDIPMGAICKHSSAMLPSGRVIVTGGNNGGAGALSGVRYLNQDGLSWQKYDG